MKILIIGAAGTIGKHVTAALQKDQTRSGYHEPGYSGLCQKRFGRTNRSDL